MPGEEPAAALQHDVVSATEEVAEAVLIAEHVPGVDEAAGEETSGAGSVVDETGRPSATDVATMEVAQPPVAPVLGAELVDGAPTGWSQTPAGIIFNEGHQRVGKISRFGPNVACKCYLRGGRCSMLKGQKDANDAMMMQWLQLGEAEVGQAGASSSAGAGPADLASQHIALWKRIAK